MAFLNNNLEEEQQQNQLASQGQAPLVGGNSQSVGQAQTQNGGAAGGGGFTNIQNYLEANKGDTGSAQALNKEVSNQFNQERDAFKTASTGFLADAEKQNKESMIDNTKAQDLTKQGAASYEWDDEQNAGYKDTVGKVRNYLTSAYQGPKEYQYGFDAKTQNYGDAVSGGAGLDSVMGEIYNKNANAPLTSGQFQLQKQLDVNSEALANTRENLKGAYQGLGQERDQTVKDTTQKLGAYEQDYRTGQNNLLDYLGAERNRYDKGIGDLETGARNAYNTTFKGDKTGNSSIPYAHVQRGLVDDHDGVTRQYMQQFINRNAWGKDMTWEQLANEQKYLGLNTNSKPLNYWDYSGTAKPEFKRRGGLLDTFYGEQNAKYADTADSEKRSYNTILDFLASADAKKQQGFKVKE